MNIRTTLNVRITKGDDDSPKKRKQNRQTSIRKPEMKSVEKCIKITVKLTNRGHTVVQDFLTGR